MAEVLHHPTPLYVPTNQFVVQRSLTAAEETSCHAVVSRSQKLAGYAAVVQGAAGVYLTPNIQPLEAHARKSTIPIETGQVLIET